MVVLFCFCCISYSVVSYLYVTCSFSELITSVEEERAIISAIDYMYL